MDDDPEPGTTNHIMRNVILRGRFSLFSVHVHKVPLL